jgi:hypothetical protein
MSDYNPDKWIVVKITQKDVSPIYKVFASWYGNYTAPESWRMNSGIAKVSLYQDLYEDVYSFEGYSGSVYECNDANYGCSVYGHGVILDMCAKAEMLGVEIEILPEETNWLEIKYAN